MRSSQNCGSSSKHSGWGLLSPWPHIFNGQVIMVGGLFGDMEDILKLCGSEVIIWSRQPTWELWFFFRRCECLFLTPGRFETEADRPVLANVIEGLHWLCERERLRTTLFRFLPAQSSISWWEPNSKVVAGKQTWNERIWATLSSGRKHFVLATEASIGFLEQNSEVENQMSASAVAVCGGPAHLTCSPSACIWSVLAGTACAPVRGHTLLCTLDPSVLTSSRSPV